MMALSTKTWVFLGGFALVVALTGGASRYDAIQIVPLRAVSGLFLIPALYYLSLKDLKKEAFLVSLFAFLVFLVAAQLVPLPPSIWPNFPERGVLLSLDVALGLENVWRPLTLSPMRTWNALGSLVVPFAGLFLALALGATSRALLHLLAALGVLNAILGLLQIVGGPSSVFYLYEITNRGGAVGIFANENHAAIFAACSMLIVVELGLRDRFERHSGWTRVVFPAAFLLILLTALVGGSRAGFAAAIGTLVVTFTMLVLAPEARRERSSADSVGHRAYMHPKLLALLPVLAIFLTVGAFIALGRSPAFADILARDSFADLRWSLWPVIVEMLGDHWLAGAGFGSFEQAYKIYEPSELLMPRYINQAHNDWVQLIIEGGAFSGVLLVGLVVWVGRSVVKLVNNRNTRVSALFWLSIFTVIAGASLIDYPLRTPLFQLYGVWALLALSRDVGELEAT
ncbi:O-antigen ligase family protein [Qipengyuania sp. YG19]|nr:O-antigen ligase family protein [Qipengyuania huizhouensis]